MANSNEPEVLLQFEGAAQGDATYIGKSTGRHYRAGALPPFNQIAVAQSDVEGLLNLRDGKLVLFTKVGAKPETDGIRSDQRSAADIQAQIDALQKQLATAQKAEESEPKPGAEKTPEQKAESPSNDMTVREATAEDLAEIEKAEKKGPGRPAKS